MWDVNDRVLVIREMLEYAFGFGKQKVKELIQKLHNCMPVVPYVSLIQLAWIRNSCEMMSRVVTFIAKEEMLGRSQI